VATLLVSDREREYTVGLLRGHLVSGRLTTEEFEQRVAEAWRARYSQELWQALRFLPTEGTPPIRRASSGTAAAALVIGIASLCVMVFTLGLLFPLGLPLGISAWALGRDARRTGAARSRGVARAGEVMGIVASLWSAVMLAGCAALLT
jgi:Domain of unknown function (DUF1707)